MHVEFDPTKAATNLKKHGISFSDAELVLFDPMALTNEDDATQGEARFGTVGVGAQNRVLTVVWTQRGNIIHLISARLATSHERRTYES
ncbi:hypothetical protein TPL01_02060 [Sulfuriferula plumbiphila]|uniref:Toxin n=1 Tax=Sulfuriferula plumbiphila TaxID=171865 RepID=A0A512L3M7_9PROT|nr:BrnT family toxin [Sulfuriferula plumbiphila]BBP02774.1 hypothetical protein SFPGR_01960 [Sulfuriferula plumbiphila]GEP29068.1 hypothetical protein TPL01_02060 [Sulfuriferula plumbiphila]